MDEQKRFYNYDRLARAIVAEAVNDIARWNRYKRKHINSKVKTHKGKTLEHRYHSAKHFMLSEYGYTLTNMNLPMIWEHVKDSERSVTLEEFY